MRRVTKKKNTNDIFFSMTTWDSLNSETMIIMKCHLTVGKKILKNIEKKFDIPFFFFALSLSFSFSFAFSFNDWKPIVSSLEHIIHIWNYIYGHSFYTIFEDFVQNSYLQNDVDREKRKKIKKRTFLTNQKELKNFGERKKIFFSSPWIP